MLGLLLVAALAILPAARGTLLTTKHIDETSLDRVPLRWTRDWMPEKRAATDTFNATSHRNLAVYYGHTPAAANESLYDTCSEDGVDIVMLSFVLQVYGAGGYPSLDMGTAKKYYCGGISSAQTAAGATGLQDCTEMGTHITQCQALGKKIMMSLGGSVGNISFDSPTNASDSATLMWNLFGGGSSNLTSLRPFGNATVDGFDMGKF